jgi:hypothetical protein
MPGSSTLWNDALAIHLRTADNNAVAWALIT